VTNLAKSQAEWTRFLAEEVVLAHFAPLRELRELYDALTRERVQIWNLGDRASATPHITALTFAGVNYGTNTSTEGRLYVRFVANGGNWDVSFYTAAGASGLVAKATNVAASATGSVAAQNSSGLTGSITLGATITGDITDLHTVLIKQDYPARLGNIFTGTDSIDDDRFSRDAVSRGYSRAAAAVLDAMAAIKNSLTEMCVATSPENPVARGNAFNSTNATALATETVKTDSDGNVSRVRGGLFVQMSDNMADEGTGGEQDVVRRVVAAGAGSFDGNNSGQGTLASSTPLEKCPVGLWTFQCSKGSDTGNLGSETFDGSFAATDGSGEGFTFSGLVVEKEWTGPRGLGPIRLRRTYSKTGDGSNLNLAAVTTGLVTGERNANTDAGTLYWKVTTNGSNWDYSFYKSSARTASTLVAKATNVATGGAISATSQNGSGMTVTWTAGSAPVADTTGTLLLQPFLVENSAGFPDKFTITTSVTGTPGLIQKMLAEEFDVALNSDTSGSESIPDNWAKVGTFVPFIQLDN
jgi:hypothetical protein